MSPGQAIGALTEVGSVASETSSWSYRHDRDLTGFLMAMLENMLGQADGVHDALTRYTEPLTGAYCFVPSTEDLQEVTRTNA